MAVEVAAPEEVEAYTIVLVEKNYLTGAPEDLSVPYVVSDGTLPMPVERLAVQKGLQDDGFRPTNLFEELNYMASSVDAGRAEGPYEIMLEPLLMGKGTPASGMQDGVCYVVDYNEGHGKGFFKNDKAKSDLLLVRWDACYKLKMGGIITPGLIFELPPELAEAMFRYGPGDVSPETGFVKRQNPDGEFYAWMSNGNRLEGLRPVTMSSEGDLNGVWNLGDCELHVVTRLAYRLTPGRAGANPRLNVPGAKQLKS